MASDPEECLVCDRPVSGVLSVLSGKYAMQILCAVGAHGSLRFGAIEAHLPGASTATLTDRLDELAAAGLVDRTRYREMPPRVEYELTERGAQLTERVEPVVEWATQRRND